MAAANPGGSSWRVRRVLVVTTLAVVMFGSLMAVIYAADGYLDPSFGAGGIVTTDIDGNNDVADSVAIEPNGMIVIAGSSGHKPYSSIAAVRYTQNGTLDTNFGVNGIVTTSIRGSDFGSSLLIQPDGMIVVAGTSCNPISFTCDFAVVRYTITGTLDPAFASASMVTTTVGDMSFGVSAAIQSDSKIVVAGSSWNGSDYDFALVRYDSDGNLDTSFGSDGIVTTTIDGDDTGYSTAVQPDGKAIVAGVSEGNLALVRYTVSGTLDSTFGSSGIVTTTIGTKNSDGRSVVLQPNNKIVVAGRTWGITNSDFIVVRYNSDGNLDTGFGSGGIVTTDVSGLGDEAHAVAIQSDGKIVVGGDGHCRDGCDLAAARYLSDGSLDSGFGSGGIVITPVGSGDAWDSGRAIAIQPDGNIVVVGCSHNGSDCDLLAARYLVLQHRVYLPITLRHSSLRSAARASTFPPPPSRPAGKGRGRRAKAYDTVCPHPSTNR